MDKGISDTVKLGGYAFIIQHDYTLGWSPKAKDDQWPQTGGLIIQTTPGEFVVAGTGIVVTFLPGSPGEAVGILGIDEGSYSNGQWKPLRRMNGDQSHQGRHLRIPAGEYGIQQLRLYRYK